jgi:hypothetical protein
MLRGIRSVGGLFVLSAALTACTTAGADLTPEERSLRETAYDCAADQYDRIFQTAGQDDRLYNPDDRNRITGMLRDSAVAGEGAGDDAERRIRNILGDDYGRLFLDAYKGCMMTNS